jgi:hypothetical protein
MIQPLARAYPSGDFPATQGVKLLVAFPSRVQGCQVQHPLPPGQREVNWHMKVVVEVDECDPLLPNPVVVPRIAKPKNDLFLMVIDPINMNAVELVVVHDQPFRTAQ